MKKKTVPKKNSKRTKLEHTKPTRKKCLHVEKSIETPVGALYFSLIDQKEDFKHAQNGWNYYDKIDQYYSVVFRPHFKYDQPIKIQNQDGDLIDYELTAHDYKVLEYFVDKLSEHFYGEE